MIPLNENAIAAAAAREADNARSERAGQLVDAIEQLEAKILRLEEEGPAGEWKREMCRQTLAQLVSQLQGA